MLKKITGAVLVLFLLVGCSEPGPKLTDMSKEIDKMCLEYRTVFDDERYDEGQKILRNLRKIQDFRYAKGVRGFTDREKAVLNNYVDDFAKYYEADLIEFLREFLLIPENVYAVLKGYKGDNISIHFRLAHWLLAEGLVKSAYHEMVLASQMSQKNMAEGKGNRFADSLGDLLKHYGCTESYEVWKTIFTGNVRNNYIDFTPVGEPYPAIEVSPDFETRVYKLRRKLEGGEVPELERSCPINLYN